MARKPNKVARVLVPLIAGLIGLAAAWAIFQGGRPQQPAGTAGQQQARQGQTEDPDAPAPADRELAEAPGGAEAEPVAPAPDRTDRAAQPGAEAGTDAEAGQTEAQPEAAEPDPADTGPGMGALPGEGDPQAGSEAGGETSTQAQEQRAEDQPARFFVQPVEPAPHTPIGGLDPDAGDKLAISFSDLGAGILSVELADFFETVKRQQHVTMQSELPGPGGTRLTPLAAYQVEIDGEWVTISAGPNGEPVWREVAPGAFEATVVDAAGEPVVRIERTYELHDGTHALTLRQRVVNLTEAPLTVAWRQVGPADLPADPGAYGGDKRRARFGYIAPDTPGVVISNDYLIERRKVVGSFARQTRLLEPLRQVWPDDRAMKQGYQLSWLGMTNRYFALAMYPAPAPPDVAAPPSLTLPEAQKGVQRVTLDRADKDAAIALLTTSAPKEAAPGGSASFDVGVFAGPLADADILLSPGAARVNLDGLVQYNFGGPCAFCTFGWITHALIWLLNMLHNYLVFDWSLAIILLVVVVRTILHPVTKWSQIRLTRFGKQMQEMAPKQKKIQEKYKDDPTKMREEMGKLWREEGVNPAGALGCLPMFLQTPVWIALYASLYFAVELRHEPAFFGVFQKLTGGEWTFMADLSRADALVPLPFSFDIPLMGTISSLNILPLLLGVVFFIHQKYMSPPPSATMTEEQLAQQRMIKIMMVVMFPIIMYNAPCGLSLYFIANSTLGIFESRYIRAHVTKLDLLPKKDRGPTFFQRLMEQADRRRQMMEQAQGRAAPRGRGGQGQPARPGQKPGQRIGQKPGQRPGQKPKRRGK